MTSRRIGAFINGVPILVLAFAALLVWLVVKGERPAPVVLRIAGIAVLIVCAMAVAWRAGPLGAAALATAAVALGVLISRHQRGDDRGDDGHDPPDAPDPDPGPGHGAEPPAGLLETEAFDRARAEWERELPKRG